MKRGNGAFPFPFSVTPTDCSGSVGFLPGGDLRREGDAAGAWIGLHEDDLTAWIYGMMYRPLPWTWFLWAGLAILLSILLSFVVFRLRARLR